MAVGDTLPHCTGTGTSADPYIYTTAQGFIEAIAVVSAYVKAGEENLVFDANDGVIPQSGIVIYNSFLNGRGTTILNLLKQNTEGNLVELNYGTYDQRHTIEVRNMNFYNMTIINNNGQNSTFVRAFPADYFQEYFINCNFSGIVRGSNVAANALFYHGNSYSGRSGYKCYQNCTFNINFDCSTTNTITMFSCDFGGTLENCTICASGTIKETGDTNQILTLVSGFSLKDTTFVNKETNPLYPYRTGYTSFVNLNISAVDTSYNYFKIYLKSKVAGTYPRLSVSNASKLLVNRSRIEGGDITGTCISMQETDTTASDYIYNADNLVNAGFLVVSVIE